MVESQESRVKQIVVTWHATASEMKLKTKMVIFLPGIQKCVICPGRQNSKFVWDAKFIKNKFIWDAKFIKNKFIWDAKFIKNKFIWDAAAVRN